MWYPERCHIGEFAFEFAIEMFPHDSGMLLASGAPIVRDEDLLESALAQPQWQYYESIYEKAAVLLRGMIKNHPFVDGNKRLGMGLTHVFLDMNGYMVTCTNVEFVEFAVSVAEAHPAPEVAELAAWFEANTEPLPDEWPLAE